MNELAESISLVKLLERHNDPADPFHMDEHQTVCVGHQFKDGVTFMCLTTPHLINNMVRSENCGCQKTGHFDGAFNLCKKDFGMIGFGMNSMGAHFNPVSLSIVKSESKEAIIQAYKATCAGLYTLYNLASICDDPSCGFCTQQRARFSLEAATRLRRSSTSALPAEQTVKRQYPTIPSSCQGVVWRRCRGAAVRLSPFR